MSKTLIPHGRFLLRRFNEPARNVVCFNRRHYSSKPHQTEIDLDSSSSSATTKAEAERKSLNEYFQKIAVKNSTPDWLPLAPGSSFWVPPPQHQKTAGKVAYMMNMVTNPLKKEEAFSLSSSSGWPCSSFFIPPNDEKVKSSVELNIPGELTHFLNPIYSFKHVDDEE
ncbi:Uncharacterized protein Rs2_28714 [Raphanus sativus]|uniref:Uncharacterized protein LOC130496308 n=1 Tax=Raphanus sativus TaxID=3726 RepID=A0A9W3BYM3_RAPSA|nr:uncharacterized protein LOC130496308 [Raphanus sativus]KAJ4888966.1 Uncharacterized protein Rs2_28714 [Raphanus sativus]